MVARQEAIGLQGIRVTLKGAVGMQRACRRLPAAAQASKGKNVVPGLVTTKSGILEDKDNLKRRIDEAAKYVPLENRRLSPQCGFASTHHGNRLTSDEQWRKLARWRARRLENGFPEWRAAGLPVER